MSVSFPNAKYASWSVVTRLHPGMQVVEVYPVRVFVSTAPPNEKNRYENMLSAGGKRVRAMPVPSVSLQICCWSSRATMYVLSEIQEPEIRCAWPLLGYTMSRASAVSATLLRVIFPDDTNTSIMTVTANGVSVDVTKRSPSPLA